MRKNLAFAFFVICLISCNERLEENRKEIKQNNLSGISTHDVYLGFKKGHLFLADDTPAPARTMSLS